LNMGLMPTSFSSVNIISRSASNLVKMPQMVCSWLRISTLLNCTWQRRQHYLFIRCWLMYLS